MLQEKLPPVTEAAAPLQVTEDSPDSESEALPVTVTADVENDAPSDGEAMVMTG